MTRQHGTVEQRCDPDGHPRQCRPDRHRGELVPALEHLRDVLRIKEREVAGIVKTGRTHLMDAMPVTLAQELSGWRTQIENGLARLAHRRAAPARACAGRHGGRHRHQCAPGVRQALLRRSWRPSPGCPSCPARNYFEALSAQDTAVELSGQLKVIAVSLMKIANDLRWMNSGPLAGLGEIALPALQPGSSIMPGKVNPVIPEATTMVAAQVIGNDTTITIAGQSGNFQLNVMLPVIAHNLLQSIHLLASVARALADSAIAGFTVNTARLAEALDRNPILVTALNPVIGYEKGAAIAKKAYAEGKPVLEVAEQMTDLPRAELSEAPRPGRAHHRGHQGRHQRRRLSVWRSRKEPQPPAPARTGPRATGRPSSARAWPAASRATASRSGACRGCRPPKASCTAAIFPPTPGRRRCSCPWSSARRSPCC